MRVREDNYSFFRALPAVVFIVAMLLAGCGSSEDQQAGGSKSWGPERDTFTWDSPADYRTFNSITDNPTLGDERNFVRVRRVGGDETFRDGIDVNPGDCCELFVYYHNNASASLNDSGAGIAENVRLSVAIPATGMANQSAAVKGTISATNALPSKVWDDAFLRCSEDVHFRYVKDSATLHNSGTADGEALDTTSLVFRR